MQRKWIAVSALIFLLFLMLYSFAEHDKKDPDMEYILNNYDKYIDKKVHFGGVVKEANGTLLKIKLLEPTYDFIDVEVENVTAEKGDVVEILGVLKEKNRVIAEKVIVSKSWKNALIFIRSLPAIPFALYFFFKKWKFNLKNFKFEERGENA